MTLLPAVDVKGGQAVQLVQGVDGTEKVFGDPLEAVLINTAGGLNQMPPVYLKLARSLRASPRQTLFAIAIPAAGPYIVAGLRLAVVYALIGTIAMEFTTAQAGLGYRIRYLYEIFDNTTMFAYIVVVLLLSCVLTVALAAVERVLLRGRNT